MIAAIQTKRGEYMLHGSFRKLVSMAMVVVFVSVLSAAAFPLHAQEAPGAVEKAGPATVQKSGGSILPIVLIGVGVLAVAAVLIFVVFKTSYDITGTWAFVITNGSDAETLMFIFTGTKTSGTWTIQSAPSTLGTYTVSDKNVSIIVTAESNMPITGAFTDKDTMAGTWPTGTHVTWTATRTAAAAGVPHAPADLLNLLSK
jgi:hypothetical protein